MWRFSSLLVLFVFIMSCAGPQKTITVVKPISPENNTPELIEDFDPAVLGEYQDRSGKRANEQTPFDLQAWLKTGPSEEASNASQHLAGFRVQLISTREEGLARSIRKDALLLFDDAIYLSYDDPYYKVRLGDCKSRREAEKLLEIAMQKDFLDAWVVRTMINLKSDFPQNDTDEQSSP